MKSEASNFGSGSFVDRFCIFRHKIEPYSKIGITTKEWKRNRNFQKIFFIIFWNFTKFLHRHDSPQIKQESISSMKKIVYGIQVAPEVVKRLKT